MQCRGFRPFGGNCVRGGSGSGYESALGIYIREDFTSIGELSKHFLQQPCHVELLTGDAQCIRLEGIVTEQ